MGPRSSVCFSLKCKYCIWLGPMSSLCFAFGMQVLQGWVPCLVCVPTIHSPRPTSLFLPCLALPTQTLPLLLFTSHTHKHTYLCPCLSPTLHTHLFTPTSLHLYARTHTHIKTHNWKRKELPFGCCVSPPSVGWL